MRVANPFHELGVSPEATKEEIREAYYDLAWELHPDRVGDDSELAQKLLRVNAAYEQLTRTAPRPQAARREAVVPRDPPIVVQPPVEAVATVSFPVNRTIFGMGILALIGLTLGFALANASGTSSSDARESGAAAGALAGQRVSAIRSRKEGYRTGHKRGLQSVQKQSAPAIPGP